MVKFFAGEFFGCEDRLLSGRPLWAGIYAFPINPAVKFVFSQRLDNLAGELYISAGVGNEDVGHTNILLNTHKHCASSSCAQSRLLDRRQEVHVNKLLASGFPRARHDYPYFMDELDATSLAQVF